LRSGDGACGWEPVLLLGIPGFRPLVPRSAAGTHLLAGLLADGW